MTTTRTERDILDRHPSDVLLEIEDDTRQARAIVVAVEAVRENEDRVRWYDGDSKTVLGHLDNLIGAARTLAEAQRDLEAYVHHHTKAIVEAARPPWAQSPEEEPRG